MGCYVGTKPAAQNRPLHGIGVLALIHQDLLVTAVESAHQNRTRLRLDQVECGQFESIKIRLVSLSHHLLSRLAIEGPAGQQAFLDGLGPARLHLLSQTGITAHQSIHQIHVDRCLLAPDGLLLLLGDPTTTQLLPGLIWVLPLGLGHEHLPKNLELPRTPLLQNIRCISLVPQILKWARETRSDIGLTSKPTLNV